MRISELDRVWRVALGLTVVCSTMAGLACSVPERSESAPEKASAATDTSEDELDVIAAHKKLILAYENGDAEGFASLLDPGSELLIFHPFVENRFDGIDEALAGMSRMFGRLKSSSWTDVHPTVGVRGDVAWLTSHVLVKSPHVDSPFVGRGTEVWLRTPEGWRLSHAHWSEHADLAGAARTR